ncbi:MAG TPA: tRNA pseudouridine(13) synthase TruD [Deltaproteobacteria bacterium]|nr:tRNA pseudouridine(13) synthase TruD [Deltaproteobacteria bacterium]
MPRLRASPEDFRVEEIPLYAPSGAGEHTFVCVEKRGRTTEDVAALFSKIAGVARRDVGYAGRKDRDAVATQWFSVPRLAPERALALALEGVRVLEAIPHRHKLRTGQLAGNRFEIVVRELDPGAAARCAEGLARLCERGMPNRFGPQRFGRDGGNAEQGLSVLRGLLPRMDRRKARFLVSALQAAVFNEALRMREAPLSSVARGEIAVVHGSGGLFRVEDAAREQPRAEAFEISATGPIFGGRALEPEGSALERERAALAAVGIDPARPLCPPRGIELRGARRPLRVRPEAASLESLPGALRLRFTLPPGSFATVLIEDLFGAEVALGPSPGDTASRGALFSCHSGGTPP